MIINTDTKKKILDLKIKFFVFFIILCIGTYFILNFIANSNKKIYLKHTTHTYEKAYNTIYYQYQELADVIYSGFLKLSKIDYKLEEIESKTPAQIKIIRQQLYLQTIQRFNDLKSKHIESINYILPDNTVFLKMKEPLNYGKKISEKRVVINEVQKIKKFASTYEIGDKDSGFRFAYPIFRGDNYLGMVCISFNEQAITSSLMKQYDVLSDFILFEKNFGKEFIKKPTEYKDANIKGYIHVVNVLEELKKNSKNSISQVNLSLKDSNILYTLGDKQKTNSIYLEDSDIVVTTIPIIHSITNNQEGFLTVLSQSREIGLLNNNYFTVLSLIIFLYLAIILLFLQQKIKTLKDKETMQEMMNKDKQLLEQAKMAQMGEMIGNIAHQWRQPLSAISTLASGTKLNYEFEILNEEDIPKNMDLIVQNTKYLSETIDTFRDFIKEDKEEKRVVIQDRIDDTLKIIKASIENYHIKLINDIDYKRPIFVTIIAEEFSQVLINLLNNAKDVIVQKNIEDGWIKISQKISKKFIVISIEDNGGGIEEDLIPKIFDPYFTTKHKFQGTGLGLYMSKTIIEKHLDGKIEVENSEHGALFSITLPLKN